jgi:enamine deaminase RidA (YjgF/YER057c/UK114 family)
MGHVVTTAIPGVHEPTGYRHLARVGDTLYVAGQIAKALDGSVVGVGDAHAQTRQVFANLAAVLASQGAGLGDVVKSTVFLTDARHIPAFREVRGSILGEDLPSSTLVIVDGLALPELLIEIEAIAVVPGPG